MSKHTPRPWTVARYGSYLTEVRDERGRRVAETWVQGAAKSREGAARQAETNEANARLIAAAPDLLEALKAMQKVGVINPTGSDAVRKAIDGMNAAIAKAEGGAA